MFPKRVAPKFTHAPFWLALSATGEPRAVVVKTDENGAIVAVIPLIARNSAITLAIAGRGYGAGYRA